MEESTTTRLLKQIKEACELVGARTEEYARISRRRLDVLSLGREIHKEKTALGERVYAMAREGQAGPLADDATVQAILDRLRNLDGSLADCEREISVIREAARDRVAEVRRKYREPEADEAHGGQRPVDSGHEEEAAAAPSDRARVPGAGGKPPDQPSA